MSGGKSVQPAAARGTAGIEGPGPRLNNPYQQRYGNQAVQDQLKKDGERQTMDGSAVTARPDGADETRRQIARREDLKREAIGAVNGAARHRVDALNAMFTDALVVFGNWSRTQERQPKDPAIITVLVDQLFSKVVGGVTSFLPSSAPKLLGAMIKHLGGNMRKSVGTLTAGQVNWAGIATVLAAAQAQLNQGLRNSPYYTDFMKALFNAHPDVFLDVIESYEALVNAGVSAQQMPGKIGAFLDRLGLVNTSSTLQASALRELMFAFKLEAVKQELKGNALYKVLPGTVTGDQADLAAGGQRRSDLEYRLRKQAGAETRRLGFGKPQRK